jgi:N-acetyltransferase 10
MKQLQKKIKSGKLDVNEDDPFELFIASTNIRYAYYHETHKILGNYLLTNAVPVRVMFCPKLKSSPQILIKLVGLLVMLVKQSVTFFYV